MEIVDEIDLERPGDSDRPSGIDAVKVAALRVASEIDDVGGGALQNERAIDLQRPRVAGRGWRDNATHCEWSRHRTLKPESRRSCHLHAAAGDRVSCGRFHAAGLNGHLPGTRIDRRANRKRLHRAEGDVATIGGQCLGIGDVSAGVQGDGHGARVGGNRTVDRQIADGIQAEGAAGSGSLGDGVDHGEITISTSAATGGNGDRVAAVERSLDGGGVRHRGGGGGREDIRISPGKGAAGSDCAADGDIAGSL